MKNAITLTLSKGRKRARVIIEEKDILSVYKRCWLRDWRIVREYWHGTGDIIVGE